MDEELTRMEVKEKQIVEWERRGKQKVIEEQKMVEKLMRNEDAGDASLKKKMNSVANNQSELSNGKYGEQCCKTKNSIEGTTPSNLKCKPIEDNQKPSSSRNGNTVSQQKKITKAENHEDQPKRRFRIQIEDVNIG